MRWVAFLRSPLDGRGDPTPDPVPRPVAIATAIISWLAAVIAFFIWAASVGLAYLSHLFVLLP